MIFISAPTRRAMIKTGIYTGNGADNRTINIGIDLASKNNVYVIIKGNLTQSAHHRIEHGQGDLTMGYGPDVDYANAIQGFKSTGFEVGGDLKCNGTDYVYSYIAIWEEP